MTFTTIYDDLFRAASDTYMPQGWDWRREKAQCIQESQLRPNAVSSAGAMGIAQFMPETWVKDVIRGMKLPAEASAYDPKFAIPANAWYMRKMWNGWTNPQREPLDRWRLALASYNAGAGNIEEAQKAANGAIPYSDIIAHLHAVTGAENSAQTIEYVRRIEGYYQLLQNAA
jgi:soluble lytic murein transglycosylase-like protein